MTQLSEKPLDINHSVGDFTPWILQPEIDARVTEMAAYLGALYAGQNIRLITVLKGGKPFADLLHAKMEDLEQGPLSIDTDSIRVKSYVGTESRELDWKTDLESPTDPRVHDVLVEDICDSGRTLSLVEQDLLARGPASLMTAVLLDRPEARADGIDYTPALVGFTIHDPEAWAIGFGLDLDEEYRELVDIYGKIVDGRMPPAFETPEFPDKPNILVPSYR